MAERKTPEQKLEELEKKMSQLQAQKKSIQQKQSKIERAQRTRRLIENGALAEKYFLNEDYTKALEGAGSFKDAYDIIKAQLDKAEIQLQAEGLDFRGTNSSTGEYYGGLSNSYQTATGLLASEMKFDFTINNYGFLAIDDLMKHITKTVKEELHKSSKKEV